MRRRVLSTLFALVGVLVPAVGRAQTRPPAESLSFDDAIRRAIEKNPSVAMAAQGILRAEALLQQATTVFRPTLGGTVTATTLDSERGFDDLVTQPRTQIISDMALSFPVLAAARWAARTQAADRVDIARIGLDETRRQIAIAAAQSYLAIIAAERQVEVTTLARDNAKAHVDFAQARLDAGAGSRLNLLRAVQEQAADEVLLEAFRFAVTRAQEALGVLVAADAPIDAAGEPAFERTAEPTSEDWLTGRSDIRFATAEIAAADRVFNDSWRDWVPSANAGFAPQFVTPSGLFQPSRTWRGFVSLSIPVLDGGSRRATRRERAVAVDTARSQLTQVELRAKSELRTAQAAVESAERALTQARFGTQTAAEVLKITDLAFRAGATTNIELIDAQRRARDADTAAALAEDRVRQSRLDLLVALGRFPQ
jgi:outer membrane protein TolC